MELAMIVMGFGFVATAALVLLLNRGIQDNEKSVQDLDRRLSQLEKEMHT